MKRRRQRAFPARPARAPAARPRIAWIAIALAALGAAAASAQPTDAERRAMRGAIAREILDEAVVEALDTAKWVRVVAVFAVEPAQAPSLRAEAARARLEPLGFRPARRFQRIPVIAGWIDARALAELVADPHVLRISLEAPVVPQLAEAVPLVNLDDTQGAGHTGAGVRVAVLDTGVDLAHPDLAGAVVAEHCFCDDGQPGPLGCCPNGQDEQSAAGAGQDDHGHGTRVAGILTSGGVHAPVGGAPDAQLVAVKVLPASGNGTVSDLLAGLDWVLHIQPDVAVVNLSLGAGLYPGDCDEADATTMAFASAVDLLYDAGVVTVAGAGNNQSGTAMIAPACVARAISVGAVWDANVGSQTFFGCTDATTAADLVTCWSNSSATTDVFAPGGRITSSRLGGTTSTQAGTSYATPVVAACAAALKGQHPEATPAEITAALASSSVSVVDPTNGHSFPRLDCQAADALFHASQVPALSERALPGLAIALAFLGLGVLLRMRPRGRGEGRR